jgi:hypothetical protein
MQQVNYNYLRQPNDVKAYLIDMPIYVYGENINILPFPALSYQPDGAQYPYIYVPIVQFAKVGAKINWNEETKTLSLTSTPRVFIDFESKLNALEMAREAARLAYREISKAVEPEEQQKKVRFNGIMDNKFVFDAVWWEGYGDAATKASTLTVGRYYSFKNEDDDENSYLVVMNVQGEKIIFRRSPWLGESWD